MSLLLPVLGEGEADFGLAEAVGVGEGDAFGAPQNSPKDIRRKIGGQSVGAVVGVGVGVGLGEGNGFLRLPQRLG